MIWLRRIGFFLLVNLGVMITLSLLINLLGLDRYLYQSGLDVTALLGFSLVWGMGGAFISLLMSRFIAKMAMGVHVIDPQRASEGERHLLSMVEQLVRNAGLKSMPEVGIYDSPEVNAFATGPTQSRALVAVSRGLLERMDSEEVEGVLSHEITHIANGDMVTLTLIQGVVNAFSIFLSRIISFALANASSSRDNREGFSRGIYFVSTMVFDIVFTLLGSMVVAYFSRIREFRADAGGAKIGGRQNMIHALEALKRTLPVADISAKPAYRAMRISSSRSGWMSLFATHPPLDERIARLQAAI
jgi:heat shock protein HtpX